MKAHCALLPTPPSFQTLPFYLCLLYGQAAQCLGASPVVCQSLNTEPNAGTGGQQVSWKGWSLVASQGKLAAPASTSQWLYFLLLGILAEGTPEPASLPRLSSLVLPPTQGTSKTVAARVSRAGSLLGAWLGCGVRAVSSSLGAGACSIRKKLRTQLTGR